MKRITQLAAATLTAGGILTGSWFLTNAQAAPVRDTCAQAIALADQMAEVNGEQVAASAALSIAVDLNMAEKVTTLTAKNVALVEEYGRLHREFRAAATSCR